MRKRALADNAATPEPHAGHEDTFAPRGGDEAASGTTPAVQHGIVPTVDADPSMERAEQAKAKRASLDAVRGVINRTSRYVFGPIARSEEPGIPGEDMQFIRASENGMMWPREYSGALFIDVLHVTSFDEYVTQNPEQVRAGRRLFFVEKDGSGQRLVFSGTVMTPESGPRLGDAAEKVPIAYGGNAAMPPSPAVEVRPTRAGYDELIEGLREDIRTVRLENMTLMTSVSTLQTKLLEAERQRLAAEAARDAAAERHERDLALLRTQHDDALAMTKALHEKDMEVLAAKAADEAHSAVADQLRDMEEEPSSFDRTMQTLADLAPIMTPIATQVGQALTEYLMDQIEERRARRRERRGDLAAGAPERTGASRAEGTHVAATPQPHDTIVPTDANDIFPPVVK